MLSPLHIWVDVNTVLTLVVLVLDVEGEGGVTLLEDDDVELVFRKD